jgi:hypothetical protein
MEEFSMSGVLDGLLSDPLQADACAYSTAPALHYFLARRPEVRQVTEAIQNGTIIPESVETFVRALQRDFRTGILFRHDLALAALAVALEGRSSRFADAFLRELAELKLAELPLSPKAVLQQHIADGFTQSQRFNVDVLGVLAL